MGGVIIIVMRPFILDDFITSNDQSGTIEDIKLFYTTIYPIIPITNIFNSILSTLHNVLDIVSYCFLFINFLYIFLAIKLIIFHE